ncbi:MAG: hypothetical protein JWO03_3893 [Bacteroidetes bacterium]|nr:hypothetical protein [Bacteroidota bacterium]
MFKTLLSVSLLFVLLFIAILSADSHRGLQPAWPAPAAYAEPAVDQINGEPMVFRTYEEFKSGKGEHLTFQKWRFLYTTGSHMRYLKARFKDTNGKTVDYSCEEFWGFRCNEGLYKSFPFTTGEVTHICFLLQYKNDGYYVWYALKNDALNFNPNKAYTESLTGDAHPFSLESKPIPAFLDCTSGRFVHDNTGRMDWPASLQDFKKNCPSRKYMLYCEQEGTTGKNGTPAAWKYVAVNP